MNTRMASKMLVTGTLSICALSRSTSTKTCGVAAWKVVNTLAMPGVAVGLGDELLRDAGELGRVHAQRILQPHREPGRRAHAAHRRRDEDEGLRLLDLRQLAAHLLGDPVDGLAQPVALLEIVEHEEQQARVGGEREGGAVAAREAVGILDAGRGQHQIPSPAARPRRCAPATIPAGSCSEMIRIARSRLGMKPVGRRCTNQPAKAISTT